MKNIAVRIAGLSALCLMLAGPVLADDKDHERARRALEAGEVLPLGEVLARIAREMPGDVLEVELERDDGRWIYEIKLLRADGALLEVEVDAATAGVIEVEHEKRGR
ncbi:PepSY domain-containing protein [Pseudazoarcus pumilus]|uniref:Peptidase n=1 Tax=Pseudazoarcus pumilus TaxID=2067960 RepID=A0A2I6S5X9_9RHOO|nr:PepSY domain-containing protein [Pseudazoarcus pumilus]AUN94660.1 peptidase [Pseudazoarcus pumilus]